MHDYFHICTDIENDDGNCKATWLTWITFDFYCYFCHNICHYDDCDWYYSVIYGQHCHLLIQVKFWYSCFRQLAYSCCLSLLFHALFGAFPFCLLFVVVFFVSLWFVCYEFFLYKCNFCGLQKVWTLLVHDILNLFWWLLHKLCLSCPLPRQA